MPGCTSTKGTKGSKTTNSRKLAANPIKERKKAAANPKLKQIFKGKVICSLGQFENCGKMLGPDDITKYVTLHGGRYEKQVTEDTTHFICSISDYKKKHPQVQAAWKLGKSKCAIVVFDWLLDCLVSKKKACKVSGAYTLDRTIKRLNKGKKDHFEYRNKFDEGVRACHQFVDNRLFHIAYDATGFEYKVVLSRINIGSNATEKSKPMVEKYTLYIFESHAIPRLYMFGAKLSRSHRPTSYYKEDCHVMEYHQAFKAFQKFFKEKTKVEWDLRCDIKQIHKEWSEKEKEMERERIKKGLLNGEKVRPFVWTPPPLGRPVGLLPWGYLRPEERESSSDESSSGSGTETDSSGGGASSASGSGEDVIYDTNSEVEESDEEEEEESSDEDEDMEDGSPGSVRGIKKGGGVGAQKTRNLAQAYIDLTSD